MATRGDGGKNRRSSPRWAKHYVILFPVNISLAQKQRMHTGKEVVYAIGPEQPYQCLVEAQAVDLDNVTIKVRVYEHSLRHPPRSNNLLLYGRLSLEDICVLNALATAFLKVAFPLEDDQYLYPNATALDSKGNINSFWRHTC